MNVIFNFVRIIQIVLVFIITYIIPREKGVSFTLLLERLGPVFIKFGQALSTRPDIIGEEESVALSRLRDKIKPFKFSKTREIFYQEFGQKIEDIFAEFEPEAIAAASIAIVHKAKLKSGEWVAVKILRPAIEAKFRRDISLFYNIARVLEFFSAEARRLQFIKVIKRFEDGLKLELDLRFEAASSSELRDNMKDDDGIYVPKVFWDLTSRRILTLEWVEGIPVDDIERLKQAGHDLKKLSANLAINFFNQAYRDGFFHADTHPGNLFVNKKGEIVVVDFGIMGRLDLETKVFVAEILRGFLNRDYDYLADVHFRAGYVPEDQDRGNFSLAMRSVGEPIIGQPVNKISVGRLLQQLFKITHDFKMNTQPQLLLFQKTLMLIEGVGSKLNPEVNMWELAEPWMEKWVINNLSPEAKFRDFILQIIKNLLDNNGK